MAAPSPAAMQRLASALDRAQVDADALAAALADPKRLATLQSVLVATGKKQPTGPDDSAVHAAASRALTRTLDAHRASDEMRTLAMGALLKRGTRRKFTDPDREAAIAFEAAKLTQAMTRGRS